MISQSMPLGVPHQNNGRHTLEEIDRMELFWEAETTLIMHKLSKDYFGYRAFYFQFLPLLAIASFTSVIGFITSGASADTAPSINIKGLPDSIFEKHDQWLNLSVGILGALSTFLTSMGKYTNYQSKRDMHAMAEDGIQNVLRSILFEEQNPHREEAGRAREHLEKQKAIFVSVEASCSAETPPEILRAFVDLEFTMKSKSFDFRATQYKRFYNMLWRAFTKRSWCCFLSMPQYIPEINIPTSDIGILIEEEYTKFKQEEADRVAPAFSSMGHLTLSKGPDTNPTFNKDPFGAVASPAGSNGSVLVDSVLNVSISNGSVLDGSTVPNTVSNDSVLNGNNDAKKASQIMKDVAWVEDSATSGAAPEGA